MASSEFKKLDSVWNHTRLSSFEKFTIFQRCVCMKLLYGLHTAWLSKSQRVKFDGFYARCIRKIIGVKSSYLSRISNKDVLKRVQAIPLGNLLLEQQLLYFGKIYRLSNDDIRRQLIFNDSSVSLKTSGNRSRGRPRAEWSKEVAFHARMAAIRYDSLEDMI